MLSRGPRRVSPLGGWFTGRELGAYLRGVLGVVVLPACRCAADGAVATLSRHRGSVERDRSAKGGEWVSVADGERMSMGDGVRTLAASTAQLSLAGGAGLEMPPRTVVRLLTSVGRDEVGVDLLVGEAKLAAGKRRVRVVSSYGARVIDPKSRVVIARDNQRMRFSVSVGRVSVEPSPGRATSVRAGEVLVLLDSSAAVSNQAEMAIASTPESGAGVALSETAVPGWSVSVDRATVLVDAGTRFAVTTVVPRDGRAVAIQFQHRGRGTHYYLRRLGGAP